jgi:hypothetical protein
MRKISTEGFKNLLVFVFFCMTTSGLFAQSNFAGTWAFNETKSNFGDSQFRFAATSMIVTQDANTLSVESTMPGRDGGEIKASARYTFDGNVSENPMFNSTRKSIVTWSADKTSLTIASTMTFDMGGETREMKSTEIWKLLDEGKVLSIESVRPGRDGGEIKTTAAYDKK